MPDQTRTTEPPSGYDRRILRSRARLAWRDANGSHELVITERKLLGSNGGSDVVVADRAVSTSHAELEVKESGLWVRDLASRNGTFIDGVRVESGCVPEGGLIKVGATEIRVAYSEPEEIPLWPESTFGQAVGPSVVMRALFALLARLAKTAHTVLLEGETGTGKEVLARAVHDHSGRKGEFITVDCGALPEGLLEAELFGHTGQAYTGAQSSRDGAIQAAKDGTLFLDEIGELPLQMQSRLLRALEGKEVRRLGDTRYTQVKVRFLAATHRDLPMMVANGSFRQDLYYRLAVFPVKVPPLRERRQDIPALVDRLLAPEARHLATPDALNQLASRPWLGNVRELRTVLSRMAVLGSLAAHPLLNGSTPSADAADVAGLELPQAWETLTHPELGQQFKALIRRLECQYLRRLLERHNGAVTAAAAAAGIHRATLHRMKADCED